MKVTKNKSPFVSLAACAAAISLGCICVPGSMLEFLANLEKQLTAPEGEWEPAAGDMATCQEKLAEIISSGGYSADDEGQFAMEYDLVAYEVNGDQLLSPQFKKVPGSLLTYQEDADRQEQLWEFVVDVIPGAYRQEVRTFIVFTDGVGGTLGAVQQLDTPSEWSLEMDLLDADNFYDLSTTLIHEAAHLFTLNTTQVATDWEMFNSPDDQEAFERGTASCSTYFLYEGCSLPGSYINRFFQRFWLELYDRWTAIQTEPDQETLDNLLDEFYGEHADQFVSDYAVSSPEEDIAESFMYFIFAPAPAGDTIAEEKLMFFYEFPELVQLRDEMMPALCRYAP